MTDPARRPAAQAIRLRCGAVGYCLYQFQARDQPARARRAGLDLSQPAVLLAVLVAPLRALRLRSILCYSTA